MSDTHTPGPWHWHEATEGYDVGTIHGPNNESVCWFGDSEQYYPTSGTPPKPADLALILAAPDMYQALVRIIRAYDGPTVDIGTAISNSMSAVRAAIAKAEGR